MVCETLSLHHCSTPGFFHLLNGRKESAAYSPFADSAVLARPLSLALIGTERAGDIRVSNWFMYLCTRNTHPHSWGKKKKKESKENPYKLPQPNQVQVPLAEVTH